MTKIAPTTKRPRGRQPIDPAKRLVRYQVLLRPDQAAKLKALPKPLVTVRAAIDEHLHITPPP